MPEVSIIVPVYKAEKTLSRCINSILSQSYADFQLILVEDGSPDDSGLLCDRYSATDPRIRVIHQANSGVSIARNKGISLATGDHILFVDSDDYLDSEYISQLLMHKSDLTICGIETRDDKDHFLYHSQYSPVCYAAKEDINFPQLYEELLLYSPYGKLFRRDFIMDNEIRFNPGITWGEDGMFVADYMKHIQTLNVIDYTGYYYIKYAGEQTLSTTVRENVVEMVITAREYCIEQMQDTAPHHYEAVKAICTDDLQWNCVYFVNKLLHNMGIKKKEKRRILQTFCSFSHVVFTLKHPHIYYPSLPRLFTALETADGSIIVKTQYKQVRRHRVKSALYPFYQAIPPFVKDIYRSIKRKVHP